MIVLWQSLGFYFPIFRARQVNELREIQAPELEQNQEEYFTEKYEKFCAEKILVQTNLCMRTHFKRYFYDEFCSYSIFTMHFVKFTMKLCYISKYLSKNLNDIAISTVSQHRLLTLLNGHSSIAFHNQLPFTDTSKCFSIYLR